MVLGGYVMFRNLTFRNCVDVSKLNEKFTLVVDCQQCLFLYKIRGVKLFCYCFVQNKTMTAYIVLYKTITK